MWRELLQMNLFPSSSKLIPHCPPPLSARMSNVRGSKEKSRPRNSSGFAPRCTMLDTMLGLPPSAPWMRLSIPQVKLLNNCCTFSFAVPLPNPVNTTCRTSATPLLFVSLKKIMSGDAPTKTPPS